MPGWIDQYKALRAAWVGSRGVAVQGTSGPLPRMIAGDCLALLGHLSAAVMRFHVDVRIREWTVGDDSFWSGSALPTHEVSVKDYLMKGVPHRQEARKRKLMIGVLGPGGVRILSSEQYVYPNMMGHELQEAQKQLMASWQAAINLSAQYLAIAPVTRPLSADEVKGFWSKYYQLVVALDVAGETPLQTDWDAAKEIATSIGRNSQEVLREAADVAGRAAAEVAQTVGEVAGSAAGGFFDQAGLTALLVTIGALYIAIN